LRNFQRGGGHNVTSWLLDRWKLNIQRIDYVLCGHNFLAFGSRPKVSGKIAVSWRGQRILINRLAKNLISAGEEKKVRHNFGDAISSEMCHAKVINKSKRLRAALTHFSRPLSTAHSRAPFPCWRKIHIKFIEQCGFGPEPKKPGPKARCVSRSINAIHSLSLKWPATRKLTFCLLAKCLSSPVA